MDFINIDSYIKSNILKEQLKFADAFVDKKSKIKSFDNMIINSSCSFLTRRFISLFIKKLFRLEVDPITKINEHNINPSKTFTIRSSKYYIELTPSNYGIYDKNIVNDFLWDTSGTLNILNNTKKTFIIWNVDLLSVSAQESLQNVIQTNSETSNFILTCSNTFSVDNSIMSNCFLVKLPIINKNVLEGLCKKMGVSKNIINDSRSSFDTYDIGLFMHNMYISKNFNYRKISFHDNIVEFYNKIRGLKKVSNKQLEWVRSSLYDYYVNHINVSFIFRCFINLIINDKSITEDLKKKMTNMALIYEYNALKGNKIIIHLEAFIYEFLYNLHT